MTDELAVSLGTMRVLMGAHNDTAVTLGGRVCVCVCGWVAPLAGGTGGVEGGGGEKVVGDGLELEPEPELELALALAVPLPLVEVNVWACPTAGETRMQSSPMLTSTSALIVYRLGCIVK